MTTTQALTVMVFLFLGMTGCFMYLLLRRSPSSSPLTPTPTSMPSTPSVDPMVEMARMMMETMREEAKESRRLTEILLLGRDQTEPPTSTSSMSSTKLPTTFDYDSTPLSPGIEAVMSREAEEDLQEALMRERAEYQQRIMELERENLARLDRQEVEDSSPGPWSAPEESSESQT